MAKSELLTTRDAAKRLGVTTARIRQLLIKSTHSRAGRDWLIGPELLRELARRNTTPGKKPKNFSP